MSNKTTETFLEALLSNGVTVTTATAHELQLVCRDIHAQHGDMDIESVTLIQVTKELIDLDKFLAFNDMEALAFHTPPDHIQ